MFHRAKDRAPVRDIQPFEGIVLDSCSASRWTYNDCGGAWFVWQSLSLREWYSIKKQKSEDERAIQAEEPAIRDAECEIKSRVEEPFLK